MKHLISILLTAVSAIGAPWKFPCPSNEIATYIAFRAAGPIAVDGHLDEATWQAAPRSPTFVDIITGKPAIHQTQAAVSWDAENLYVAFWVEEPLLQAKYTNHNDPIYYDNDVEVFIAGPDAYYEFEVNAFNTVYEAFFIWKEAYDRFKGMPEFAPEKLKSFNGIDFKTHPRGERLGAFAWTVPGKKTAVALKGTINNHTDRDRGWTVELAFPWKGIAAALSTDLPPSHGQILRMDFSRFNTYKAALPETDSGGWVWTRHGIWDSHIPECFAQVRFDTNSANQSGFVNLFDGKTLAGWEAPDLTYWSVEDGAITGRITTEHPCATNQYLVWMGGNLGDFELKLKSRVTGEGGINNGFQFRSRLMADRDVAGYQVDNNLKTDWLVRLYDEHGRHTLAWRGERTVFGRDGKTTHSKIDEAQGPASFKLEDWHEYHLICQGPRLTLRVNDTLVAEVIDNDPLNADASGILALQLHSGPPTFVQFKDIRLKKL